ncbi:MAG: hypothetical protein A2W90_23435 [Bacteroidetes bacterium GWF2_42_66]|nr:MAG: hypothetical protein A2W92_20175 [Bacteroidetes bacterium GWA2_42_15]OFY00350.1 MAG: hypothetical protein A2W89_14230 [Bacteroidetes bacterium GWE2_42_39]OFY47080.1 MAG: hypothetical protein A2W90_23435 [Bacteroidetes bacterium GWF2_42_66]HBL76750.1 hypothetical protein [Prolixibacteraceae bacterium]HCU62869.1 hypothetical protein [Prolixibacteraceae bacterium]
MSEIAFKVYMKMKFLLPACPPFLSRLFCLLCFCFSTHYYPEKETTTGLFPPQEKKREEKRRSGR